jgi:hypothetical protein
MSRWLPTTAREVHTCSGVQPKLQELWQVASRDWIKKYLIIKMVPCAVILDNAEEKYRYMSTDVFQDESPYNVPLQWQTSIFKQYQHFCSSSCFPLTFVAARLYHRCKVKINLHLRSVYDESVVCSGMKPRGIIQSGAGHHMCYSNRGVVLSMSDNVRKIWDVRHVFDMWGKERGVGGK